MSHLDDAKALVAQHIDASQKVFDLLDQITANDATAAQAAVADLSAANDTLTQQINASLTKLREIVAQRAGTTEATAQPVL